MPAKDPIDVLEQTLRPHLRERMPHERTGTPVHLQEALAFVRAVRERIDDHGFFVFPKIENPGGGLVEGTFFLPDAMIEDRRRPGKGIVVSASTQPELPKWLGYGALSRAVDTMRRQRSLADKIGEGSGTGGLVRSALNITFDRWGGNQCFRYDWMPHEMQQQLREGVIRTLSSMISKIVFDPHQSGYDIQQLWQIASLFPNRIPWCEVDDDWLVVTG